MKLQLYIDGKLVKESLVWGPNMDEMVAHFRNLTKQTTKPWEIVLVRRVVPKRMKSRLRKRWDKWVSNNPESFKINKQWDTYTNGVLK